LPKKFPKHYSIKKTAENWLWSDERGKKSLNAAAPSAIKEKNNTRVELRLFYRKKTGLFSEKANQRLVERPEIVYTSLLARANGFRSVKSLTRGCFFLLFIYPVTSRPETGKIKQSNDFHD
jgi:hypothetical protein